MDISIERHSINGNFIDGHFIERYFIERHFIDRTFHRSTFHISDISYRWDISYRSDITYRWTIHRSDISYIYIYIWTFDIDGDISYRWTFHSSDKSNIFLSMKCLNIIICSNILKLISFWFWMLKLYDLVKSKYWTGNVYYALYAKNIKSKWIC